MDKISRIAELNDQLRRDFIGGKVLITPGIQALGSDAGGEIISAVRAFSAFTTDNDPYGEHDCAVVDVGDHRVIWKIDYYDLSMAYGSDDPTNSEATLRLLTIMLADEW